jgi:hypothetical protein
MRGCLKVLGHPERVVGVADSFEGLPEPDVVRTKERDFFHSPVTQKAYQSPPTVLFPYQAGRRCGPAFWHQAGA